MGCLQPQAHQRYQQKIHLISGLDPYQISTDRFRSVTKYNKHPRHVELSSFRDMGVHFRTVQKLQDVRLTDGMTQ